MNWLETLTLMITNVVAIGAIVVWAVSRAIKYTHLERDVKELQAHSEKTDDKFDEVEEDLKGLSIKIDKAGLGFRLKD